MIEICLLIHVDKFVIEKEDLIVLILVLKYVIQENVHHVNIKELWLIVNVEKVKEWSNVVKIGLYINVVKNVKNCWIVKNINVKEIVTLVFVNHAKRRKWQVASVVKIVTSLTVSKLAIHVDLFAAKSFLVDITIVNWSVILNNVIIVLILLNYRLLVLVGSIPFKCWLVILISDKVVQTLSLFVECLVIKN